MALYGRLQAQEETALCVDKWWLEIPVIRMKSSSRQLTILGSGRDLKLVYLAAFFAWMAFGIYVTTFNNFAVQSIHMNPTQLGLLESIRESPGLAMAFILALAMHIAEPTLASVGLFLIAAGFFGYTQTTTLAPLVMYSLLWSVGLHCWMPLQSAMTLSLAEEGHKGRRLGQVSGCAGLGTAIGILAVVVFRERISFSAWYTITAIGFVVSAVVIMFVRKDLSPPDKPRLVFKRRYLLYYVLTFLDGCRKQVFITWAPFILVNVYHSSLWHIAILMLINNVVNLAENPFVGKLVDRRGERGLLAICYLLLVGVFAGYGMVTHIYWLYALYFLDNFLYVAPIGLTSYINRIAKGDDLVPSLTMGVTTNHIGSIAVPAIGALLWAKFGYPSIFYCGTIVVIASLALTMRIKGKAEAVG